MPPYLLPVSVGMNGHTEQKLYNDLVFIPTVALLLEIRYEEETEERPCNQILTLP